MEIKYLNTSNYDFRLTYGAFFKNNKILQNESNLAFEGSEKTSNELHIK